MQTALFCRANAARESRNLPITEVSRLNHVPFKDDAGVLSGARTC
jgi:hypothetical protein